MVAKHQRRREKYCILKDYNNVSLSGTKNVYIFYKRLTMEQMRDRYVSFNNIDCYENATLVLDAMYTLFGRYPEAKDAFWVRFETLIPKEYKTIFAKHDSKDILYHICSHVFYLSILFEEYDFQEGIELIEKAELECC